MVFSNLVGEEHYRNNIKFSTNSYCKVLVTQVTVTYPESLLSVTWRLQGPKDGPKAGGRPRASHTLTKRCVLSYAPHFTGQGGGEDQMPRRDSEGN